MHLLNKQRINLFVYVIYSTYPRMIFAIHFALCSSKSSIIALARSRLRYPNVIFSSSVVLSTNLFTVAFKKKFEEGNDNAVRGFIQHNDCVELNCDIRIEKDNIELH